MASAKTAKTSAKRPTPSAARAPSRAIAPPVKTAVLATDFSPAALGAAHAARWAREALGVKVVVVTALGPADGAPVGRKALADWRSRARRSAEAYLAAHGLEGAAIEAVEGEPSGAIMGVVKKRGADLVIVGRRGAHGERQRALGAVARRIVRLSPTSVLIARREFDGGVRTIGASTDLSPGAERAVRRAAEIARRCNIPAVHALHAVGESSGAFTGYSAEEFAALRTSAAEEHVASLVRALGPASPALRLSTSEGRVAEAIASLAKRRRLDLLCVGSHGAGRTPTLLGSTAERLLDITPCSVWVEKAREDQKGLLERFAALIG